jgi:hypothetical protein
MSLKKKSRPKPVSRLGRPSIPYPESDSPLVWGAENIAKVLGRNRTFVYHAHKEGRLPITSMGNTLVGRRDELTDPTKWPRPEKVGG